MPRLANLLFAFLVIMDKEGRGLELHMAKVLLLFGLLLLLPGDTLSARVYVALVGYGVTEMVLAALSLCLAMIRGLALYINGYHHRTPLLRAGTSMASCMLFGGLSYISWTEYWFGIIEQPTVAMAFYPAFVLAEFRAASRIRWERVNAYV